MIVLDASVVLKWIFDDKEASDRAGRFKDEHVAGTDVVAAPDLLFYEIANVLATKTRLSERAISQAFGLLWEFEFERFDLGEAEFLEGLALSRKYMITLYDASYIVLAKRLKCAFVTSDKKLYERVKTLKMVELL